MSIAMTFDDGPSNKTTPKLLDLLEELNIQATFFVLGKMVKQNPGVLKNIASARQQHEICNHSWDHPRFHYKKTKLTDKEIRTQIEDTQKAIEDAGGKSSVAKIFRPPYGLIKDEQKKFIREELGYKVVGWNVDPTDWKAISSEQITKNIVGSTKDGQVILAHDIHERTVNAMPETLKTLQKKFTFTTVSKLGNYTEGGLSFLIRCGCDGFIV